MNGRTYIKGNGKALNVPGGIPVMKIQKRLKEMEKKQDKETQEIKNVPSQRLLRNLNIVFGETAKAFRAVPFLPFANLNASFGELGDKKRRQRGAGKETPFCTV